MAEEYNDFEIVQGQKFTVALSVEDDSGVILPLAGMKARMQIMYDDYDGEVALTLTTENGGITIVNNELQFVIKTAQAALLKATTAVYEVELIDSANEVTGWLRGNIKLLKGKV
jgi:hypothetical protein